ncbi:flavin adenine dinucleotide transporter [Martiniozyma asiatica (nom. inval.)]|nr:flavin adenine dinucleotide transporter [Martiniozyma asiatica]
MAKHRLYANSLVNCMENSTNIQPDYFNVVFNPSDRSLQYDISLTAKIEGKLKAYATVYAFGFDIIHETIDLCNLGLKQFCPITPSHMEVESIQYIDKKYVDMIPSIAYTFPDIDIVARLVITDENNGILGCLQTDVTNGKTVSHEGAKWATAVVAGIGLLVSGFLSLFGNSASSARMSAFAISLFTYFQSVVIISMINVEQTPPLAASWAENLAWSMGLIRIEFMQKIFRWYIQATGGTPTQFLTTNAYEILTARSLSNIIRNSFIGTFVNYIFPTFTTSYQNENLYGRATDINDQFTELNDVESNNYLTVLRGMKRVGFSANIEPTSIVCTGFTFFIICLYVLVGFYFIFKLTVKIMKKKETSKFNKVIDTEQSWSSTFKGVLLRYIYIGFPQLIIFSLWEFTVNDSAGIVTLSVFFFILALSTMAYSTYKVFYYATSSIKEQKNPAAYLYGNSDVLNRYGFLYTMFDAKKFWFCAVILGYTFVKALFVSLAQNSGKTQAMAIWIIDMVYLGILIHFMPYLDKFTNILSVFIAVIVTLNSFFFTFFSGIYNQQVDVASVMGIIFFIMNAIVSLILLIGILFIAAITIFMKNPDSRFSPTKDDRTSFQRKNFNHGDASADDLFALAQVANNHDLNWTNDIYGLTQEKEDNLNRAHSTVSAGLSKVFGKLARGFSTKRNDSEVVLKSEHEVSGMKSQNMDSSGEYYLADEISDNDEYHDYNEYGNNQINADDYSFENNGNRNRQSMEISNEDQNQPMILDPFKSQRSSFIGHARQESEAGLSTHGEKIDESKYFGL